MSCYQVALESMLDRLFVYQDALRECKAPPKSERVFARIVRKADSSMCRLMWHLGSVIDMYKGLLHDDMVDELTDEDTDDEEEDTDSEDEGGNHKDEQQGERKDEHELPTAGGFDALSLVSTGNGL